MLSFVISNFVLAVASIDISLLIFLIFCSHHLFSKIVRFVSICVLAQETTQAVFLRLHLANIEQDDSTTKYAASSIYGGGHVLLCWSVLFPKIGLSNGDTPWTKPSGLEAYHQLKELRPVFGHKLVTVWNELGPKVCQLLDSQGVLWTSIGVVRFIKVREGEAAGPVILWIGVAPNSLLSLDARTSANGCLDLLEDFNIADIEVEYRESIYTKSSGPKLLEPVLNQDPIADVCGPLTPALGLSIAAKATPYIGGTGGIYLAEGGNSKKALLVTARHVLLPPDVVPNDHYARTNTSSIRLTVLLLGTGAFDKFLNSIDLRIERHAIMVRHYTVLIEKLQTKQAGIEDALRELKEANEAIEALQNSRTEVQKEWHQPSQRVLGHIVRSPPITFNAGTKSEGFTEDYAIAELDSTKIKKSFKGNVIDLGTKIPIDEFTMKMSPRADAPSRFDYPVDRLLQLQDLITEDLMQNPNLLDQNGEPCLFVIKNGMATGVTVGRANGIFSLTREYYDNTSHVSKEWSILPYDKSSVFSACGDSGSIITDGLGRIGGLLMGGSGANRESLDVTYATPFFWLFDRIQKNGFPDAHLYPVID